MSWALPLALDPQGRFPSVRPDPLADTARLILGVAPGERPLAPGFGWEGHRLDLADPIQRQAAAAFAEEALRRWAPDLGIDRVEVLAPEGGRVEVSLHRGGSARRIGITLRGREAP